MTEKKKTNGRRNRSAGHDWEKEVAALLRDRKLYPHAITTRQGSHDIDAMGIDLMNREESINGVMNDTVSAKNYCKSLNYSVLLTRLGLSGRPHPVVFHKQTARAMTGTRFLPKGSYAITDLDNQLELMACRIAIRRIKNLHGVENNVPLLAILEELGL